MTTSVRFTTVATGPYVKYWEGFVQSVLRINESIPDEFEISFAVLTDSPTSVSQYSRQLGVTAVKVFEFPEITWPAATLLRYEAYSVHRDEIQDGVDYVVHVDADMLLRSWPTARLWEQLDRAGVLLVRHPGYFRSRNPITRMISLDLGEMVSDRRRLKFMGGLGDWETNPHSAAYVPRNQRRDYVCGGVWFATPQEFSRLTVKIAAQIRLDSEKGFIAKWHDESHLNQWAAENPSRHEVLGPEFCFVEGYRHLAGMEPVIEAVEKGTNRVR